MNLTHHSSCYSYISVSTKRVLRFYILSSSWQNVCFLTNSEDEVVLDGVLFPPPNAVHTGRPLNGLLLDVTAAWRLQPLLHAV